MNNLTDKLKHDGRYKVFAWNGVAFLVPKSWELAMTKLDRGLDSIMLEDETQPRLELEWMFPNTSLNRDKLQKNCQKQARSLTEVSESVVEITGMQREWTAHEYRMNDGRTLVVAYRVPGELGFPFPFFKLHFSPSSPQPPAVCFRTIANSFTYFNKGVAPWSFYDVYFALNRAFKLSAVSLMAGRKTLTFEWKLRRLFLSFFSLADMALREKTLGDWSADFLNKLKLFPVPTWYACGDDLEYTRKRRYFPGQFEEIGRMCFKYHAEAKHILEKNQIAVWVLQHRSSKDLDFPELDLNP